MQMKYGSGTIDVHVPQEDIIDVLYGNKVESAPSEEAAIRAALESPIGTPRLREIVKPGERVCIVVADVTRLWQRMSTFLPFIVEELQTDDIFFVSGMGTHRGQTADEHRKLIGALYDKYKIYDHDCKDESQLVKVGTTSFGTPVELNRRVVEADRVIITGGVVYHFMAGWGGGRKAVLPGVASYKTVQANHLLALDPETGKGRNLNVYSGHYDDNVLQQDMIEATAMLDPCFMFNVITDAEGKIGWAVAGHWEKAHVAGTKIVDSLCLVKIKEKADLVIASGGGYPRDINLYQTSKPIFSAQDAAKPGGSVVVLSSCIEGYGNAEVETMLTEFKTTLEREHEMRRDFSISKYVGYCIGDIADKFDLYLVTEMDAASLASTGINVCRSLDEALEKIYKKRGRGLKTILMPDGGNTLPKV